MQQIWLTACLAVFNIALPHSGGRVYLGFIPLATARALKAGIHIFRIIKNGRLFPAAAV
jgi:hypothetical protein